MIFYSGKNGNNRQELKLDIVLSKQQDNVSSDIFNYFLSSRCLFPNNSRPRNTIIPYKMIIL